MAYEDALRFFRNNCSLENKEERPVEYNFINGFVVLTETIQEDMTDIKSRLEDLRRRIVRLEEK